MLFKTTEELQEYLPIYSSYDFSIIKPFIAEAERLYMAKVLGTGFMAWLQAQYDSETPDPTFETILPYIQRPIAYLAFYTGFDLITVSISNAGVHQVDKEGMRTAFLRKEKLAKAKFYVSGFNYIDELLAFLEENISDYPDFTNPVKFTDYFINSTAEFDAIVNINNSRIIFLKTIQLQKLSEDFTVAPILGSNFYAELKAQIKAGTLTVANQKLLPYIQKLVAYDSVVQGGFTFWEEITNKKFNTQGSTQDSTTDGMDAVNNEYLRDTFQNMKYFVTSYRSLLESFLKSNITDYPTYEAQMGTDSTIVTGTDKIVVI